MVKAAVDVTPTVERYVERLNREFDVHRVFLSDIETAGIDGKVTSIRMVVIAPTFRGMDLQRRIEKLVPIGLDSSPTIEAWAYTPEELSAMQKGKGPDLLLPQLLNGSREVYRKPGIIPLERPAKRQEDSNDRE